VAPEGSKEIELEIAHVLFLDIVGYSKLSVNEQHARVEELNEIVRTSEQFQKAEAANRILKIPTGDGMALVFYKSPEEPAQCAFEISRALKDNQRLQVRMGIHSGPISGVVDVNERTNVAGAGINLAQRVMDCGDAGHILLSHHVAEDLAEYERWRPFLHDIGTLEVKHGVRVSVTNLYSDEVGNSNLPSKLEAVKKHRAHVRWAAVAIGLLVVVALGAVLLSFLRKGPTRSLAGAVEKSIAVLPFENLSSDKENAFFADGVQDEILTDLAKIRELKVISRTSVMQYKTGAPRNLREIAQQLGVAHVVEGSVQRAANKVRVNAQLIDARNDAHLWAHTYDRDLADVFAIQSEIAKAIADQLQAKLSPNEKAAIEQAPTADLIANALYVQARELSFQNESEKENLLKAVPLLEQAVTRDPHFVRAYCLLGRSHIQLFFGGYDHTPARREMANAAIQNALRLQPDSGEVHLALAEYAFHGFRDYDRARAELDIARRTLPNDPNLYFWNAAIDRRQGRWAEAVRNFARAAELDPRNPEAWDAAGQTYRALRRYAEAQQMFDRVVALRPHDYFARIVRALPSLDGRADIRPLRTELSVILTQEPAAAADIADVLFECATFERNLTETSRAVAAVPAEGIASHANFVYPREWFAGVAARIFHDPDTERRSFTAARATEEKVVREQPEYAPAWSLLGQIDAALGRKEDAIREGRRACELMPISQDAYSGPAMITQLAVIYGWTGEKDLALEQLRMSAEVPNNRISYGRLQLDPQWDSLRRDPRFDKIVASLAPK
jgi:TolB-like protein/class 3 adenylate cyclase/cytochrome c-type biogenesis protein CcmH/NrfG